MSIKNDWLYKSYKTKGGTKVNVITVNGPDSKHPIVAARNEHGSWTYYSVTDEGKEFVNLDSVNDLIEVEKITVKQIFIWQGPREALHGHLGNKSHTLQFGDGVTVSELREVIE